MLQGESEGGMTLDFHAQHTEVVDESEFSVDPSSYPYWNVLENSYITAATLTITITDGSTTKYLKQDDGGLLTWSATTETIAIYRGLFVGAGTTSSLINSTGGTAVGAVSNGVALATNSSSNNYPQSLYTNMPCNGEWNLASNKYTFTTDIKFNANVENPGITGDVSFQLVAENEYYKAKSISTYPGWNTAFAAMTTGTTPHPTLDSTTTECVSINLLPVGQNSWQESGEKITYESEQTTNSSLENFDLGDYNLGQSSVGAEYSVQYLSSGGITTPVIAGFQRGNPTPDNAVNILQLVTKEFLALQVEPLEILQADIQSANISPLKLLKYSINGDFAYKYYVFMGGTFKAQSEIMSGEWYKIDSNVTGIILPDPKSKSPNKFKKLTPTNENQVALNNVSDLINKSVGVTDSDLNIGTSYDKVEIDANSKCKIYDNQKIILSYADGSNQLVLTADGDNLTTSDQINVDNFTPITKYPSGCVVSILPYDLTNVITGGGTPGGSSKEVQFNDGGAFGAEATFEYDKTTNFLTADNIEGQHYGDNIGVVNGTTIHLSPTDFQVTTTTGVVMYTRDHLGSVQPSSYVSRSKVYASTYIPKGYKVTDVDVYSSANRDIEVFTSRTISDATTSRGTGISNTTLTLAPAWDCVVGDYIIIYFEFGASSDKIYGSKITIAKI